jgi:hypothetical protein
MFADCPPGVFTHSALRCCSWPQRAAPAPGSCPWRSNLERSQRHPGWRLDRVIIQFPERNTLIRQWISHFHRSARSTVAVVTRSVYVFIVKALLKQEVDPERVCILTGHEQKQPGPARCLVAVV